MIIWGSGGDVVNLGEHETRRCETCEKERPFVVVLQYRYWGFFWIFNFVTSRKYLLVCDVCQRGWELERRKTENAIASVPIPFMRRFGILVFIGMVAAVAVLESFGIRP